MYAYVYGAAGASPSSIMYRFRLISWNVAGKVGRQREQPSPIDDPPPSRAGIVRSAMSRVTVRLP
jgi:hypothetical protein